jgi:diguanylate cyclase (GGDEF)-like protein
MTEAMSIVDIERGTLVCFDLDRFKSLNDTLGHPAGDAALQTIAGILEDLVRENDTAARVGGEEFAVWLPKTTLEEGLAVAERIRSRIEQAGVELAGQVVAARGVVRRRVVAGDHPVARQPAGAGRRGAVSRQVEWPESG